MDRMVRGQLYAAPASLLLEQSCPRSLRPVPLPVPSSRYLLPVVISSLSPIPCPNSFLSSARVPASTSSASYFLQVPAITSSSLLPAVFFPFPVLLPSSKLPASGALPVPSSLSVPPPLVPPSKVPSSSSHFLLLLGAPFARPAGEALRPPAPPPAFLRCNPSPSCARARRRLLLRNCTCHMCLFRPPLRPHHLPRFIAAHPPSPCCARL